MKGSVILSFKEQVPGAITIEVTKNKFYIFSYKVHVKWISNYSLHDFRDILSKNYSNSHDLSSIFKALTSKKYHVHFTS